MVDGVVDGMVDGMVGRSIVTAPRPAPNISRLARPPAQAALLDGLD